MPILNRVTTKQSRIGLLFYYHSKKFIELTKILYQ